MTINQVWINKAVINQVFIIKTSSFSPDNHEGKSHETPVRYKNDKRKSAKWNPSEAFEVEAS